MCRLPVAPARAAFLKLRSPILTTSLPAITVPRRPKPKDPPPSSAFVHQAYFPRSMHSLAQRENPLGCRAPGITPTNRCYLDRFGFVPLAPRDPPRIVHPIASVAPLHRQFVFSTRPCKASIRVHSRPNVYPLILLSWYQWPTSPFGPKISLRSFLREKPSW